ncbi:antibiotic biosynthesis monooxygenase family protein [Sorangium sp. So ce1078]|uniref:antibiotic biosynthesis monooxygenase family protein n=1 Tax=Sorangium sp. So ce1078 TaxID=3133329 RepID=UPI003F636859
MFRVDSALSRAVLIALSAALAPACSAEGEEGTTDDTSGGAGAPTAASEFTCTDDDLESLAPFGGPGFKDGALTGAAQDTYVASSTLLWLKPDEASQRRFGELMAPIASQLPTQEGLIGFALGTSARCGYARTVTVWKDEEAMGKFVMSDAHVAAMGAGSDVSVHGAVTHWTVGAGDLPLSWEVAREKIAAAEISY